MFNYNQNYNSDNIKNDNYDFNNFDYFNDNNIKYNYSNNNNFWNNNNYRYNNDYHYKYYNNNQRYNSKKRNNSVYKYKKDNIKDYYNNVNNYKKYNNNNKIKQNYYNHNNNNYFNDEMNRNEKENNKNKYYYNDNDANSDYEYNYHDFYPDSGEDSSDDINDEEYYEKLSSNDKSRYGYMYELPDVNQRLIILDTEVSGRYRKDFTILEVCAFEMINGKMTNNNFHSFFKPKNGMALRSIKKHRVPDKAFSYTPEDEIEALLDLSWFIGTSLIITHNASYDLYIINKSLEKYNLPIINPNQYRCSMRIFLNYYPEYSVKFSQLKECCNYLKIKYRNRRLHLASYDAYLVGKLMEKIYRDQADKNCQKNLILNKDESIDHKIDQQDYMIIKKYENKEKENIYVNNDKNINKLIENISNIKYEDEEKEISYINNDNNINKLIENINDIKYEDEEKEKSNDNNDNNINKLIGNISDIKEEKKRDKKEDELDNFIDNIIENIIAKKEEEESLENFINENIEKIVLEESQKEKNNHNESDSMGEFINENLDEIILLLNDYDNEEYLRKKRKLN